MIIISSYISNRPLTITKYFPEKPIVTRPHGLHHDILQFPQPVGTATIIIREKRREDHEHNERRKPQREKDAFPNALPQGGDAIRPDGGEIGAVLGREIQLCGAGPDEVKVAGRGLGVCGIWSEGGIRRIVPLPRGGGEKRTRLQRGRLLIVFIRMLRHRVFRAIRVGKRIASNDDVAVSVAGAFGRDDARVVGQHYLVDDPDQGFMPSILVVVLSLSLVLVLVLVLEERGFLDICTTSSNISVFNTVSTFLFLPFVLVSSTSRPELRPRKARLYIRHAGEIKGQSQLRHVDVDLRKRSDAAASAERLYREVRAVCEVQHRLLLFFKLFLLGCPVSVSVMVVGVGGDLPWKIPVLFQRIWSSRSLQSLCGGSWERLAGPMARGILFGTATSECEYSPVESRAFGHDRFVDADLIEVDIDAPGDNPYSSVMKYLRLIVDRIAQHAP